MVKVRMNTADVAAEVKCLRRLIGMRCANVYDLSPKVPLFSSSCSINPVINFAFAVCDCPNWFSICRRICWSLWTVAESPSPARARRCSCWLKAVSDCTLLPMFGMPILHLCAVAVLLIIMKESSLFWYWRFRIIRGFVLVLLNIVGTKVILHLGLRSKLGSIYEQEG